MNLISNISLFSQHLDKFSKEFVICFAIIHFSFPEYSIKDGQALWILVNETIMCGAVDFAVVWCQVMEDN